MSKTFNDWLGEGEQIYSRVVKEFETIESQLNELEQQLATKKDEVNQIAAVIGKPPVHNERRVTAQIIDNPPLNTAPAGAMARALSGRGLTGRQL